MDYSIREAKVTDMPEVWQLIKELAVFEKEADAVETTVADLTEDGFGTHKRFHCFVAVAGDKLVGMALVYPRYSTWKGSVIHLEDLIVTQKMRGSGLGTALLDEVVKYAARLGVKRISWEVLDWNEPAIKFYQAKGATILRDWDVVQLDAAGIKKYLDTIKS
jgi:GNAT superfamily N-acetyltransferase